MAIPYEDIAEIRRLIREEIQAAIAALFLAARVEDFAGIMTPALETRVRDALANIECNSEKV